MSVVNRRAELLGDRVQVDDLVFGALVLVDEPVFPRARWTSDDGYLPSVGPLSWPNASSITFVVRVFGRPSAL